MIRVFTLGHARTFSITMSPDITCIKNGTIIMALHEFEYLPRSIRGKSSWEGEALEYTVVQALAFSVSISAINRRGFSCNTLQLGVNWVGKYLGIDIIGVCLSR